ncbi:MAG TPA: NYN domain-containing protein [Candidatus Paceibacterota bacterium]
MKRTFVFIDGSNFYYRIKNIADFYAKETRQEFSLSRFKFKEFCIWLTKANDLQEIHYYVGQVKRPGAHSKNSEKVEKMYSDQQRLVGYLQSNGIEIKFGKLMKDLGRPGSYHEKGVDVQIAVEMIRFARQDKYDVAYLISSDTDLVPAVQEVRDLGKEVVYVGIKRIPQPDDNNRDAFGISYGLLKTANDIKLVEKETVKEFLTPREQKK